jgi:hypothetical protein
MEIKRAAKILWEEAQHVMPRSDVWLKLMQADKGLPVVAIDLFREERRYRVSEWWHQNYFSTFDDVYWRFQCRRMICQLLGMGVAK